MILFVSESLALVTDCRGNWNTVMKPLQQSSQVSGKSEVKV